MHTPTLFARLSAAVVLTLAPLSLLGAMNDDIARQLNLTRYVEPTFPDMARIDGLAEGHVALAIGRTPDGTPRDVLVLKATDPLLATAALEAARQWRFAPTSDPAELGTRTVRIGFRLNGVIVYPFGKRTIDAVLGAVDESKLGDPVRVPLVQSLSQTPKPLAQAMPVYPAALQAKPITGEAKVRFYVDEDGRVRLPEIIEASSPEFANAALTAVAQWRYEPPQHDGRRVVASEQWAFQFKATN